MGCPLPVRAGEIFPPQEGPHYTLEASSMRLLSSWACSRLGNQSHFAPIDDPELP